MSKKKMVILFSPEGLFCIGGQMIYKSIDLPT